MKKSIITLAVLVMAFGNVGFAQIEANQKSDATANVLKHYGVRDEITVVPETCLLKILDGSKGRSIYTYDEYDHYLIEELYSVCMSEQWMNLARITYEYDFDGNVMEKLTQMDPTGMGNWTDRELVNYFYEDGELSEVIYQSWAGDAWENKTKEVYNYNGDVVTVLYWDWNGTTWSSDELYTYTYSDTSIELLIQYMQGGAWQNDEKQTYTLDFDQKVLEILVEDWEGTNWEKDEKVTYNYENNVYTSKLIEEWNGAAWEGEYRSHYTYENGNATFGECEKMDNGEWVPADGPIEIAYGYNAASIDFNCYQLEASYIDLTGVEENTPDVSFNVYPVPAENEIQIQAEGFQKAEIFTLTGQMQLESVKNTIDISGLATGIYMLKVYDQAGNSAMQKFVVK